MIIQGKYTIELHGKFEARIKSLYRIITGNECRVVSEFNTTSYNHFTKEFDLFKELNQRLVVFDTSDVSEKYNDVAISFAKTFTRIYDNEGNAYMVQRDIYAASKMLYLYEVEEERISKEGNPYTVIVSKFDQARYEKFFKETFYPEHIKIVKYLIDMYNLGIDINGTILGTNNKNKK